MDLKKIGIFLKELRREKGLTQEQAAEIFEVSGRTVSRWETGVNMPDLSILIQIAEFYNVEIKELLNGERTGGNMDKELKETLEQVADYSELEKQKALKIGKIAFLLMFAACAAAIAVQLLLTGSLKLVLGETAVLCLGGAVYIWLTVRNGLWEMGRRNKNTAAGDAVISAVCGGIFSVVYGFQLVKMGAEEAQAGRLALIFFVGITVFAFLILRLLAYFNKKKRKSAERETL